MVQGRQSAIILTHNALAPLANIRREMNGAAIKAALYYHSGLLSSDQSILHATFRLQAIRLNLLHQPWQHFTDHCEPQIEHG